MGKKPLCLLIVCIALRVSAADLWASSRASIEQLERIVSASQTRSDAEAAKQLLALELTERLGMARLQQLKAALPGEKSRQALIALADMSAFLPPPGYEIPATAAPDQASQRRMLALTVKYLAKALPVLPNLFASRDTIRFESRPNPVPDDNESPLRTAGQSAVTVFYRNGQEFLDAPPAKNAKHRTPDRGLATWGEFGPILSTVFIDAAQNRLEWSHWELSGAAPQAVFRYSIPQAKSHYDIRFCCITESYGMETNLLTERTGYHGEITVDPDSGTILRLTVTADLDPGNPIARASLLVEYAPVELGGKPYICPVRGIAVALAPDPKTVDNTLALRQTATSSNTRPTVAKTSLTTLAHAPQQVLLNDVTFRDYHLFRADLRMVTGKEEQQVAAASQVATTPSPQPSTAETSKPTEEAAAEPPPPPAQPASEAVAP